MLETRKEKGIVSPVKREMEIMDTNIEIILERLSQLTHKLEDFLPETNTKVCEKNIPTEEALNESPFVNKMKDNNRMLKGCIDRISFLTSNLEV